MKKFIKPLLISSIFLPAIAFAQLEKTYATLWNAKTIISNILIPIVFSLALLYFFYGLAKYIRSVGEAKEEGRMMMVWGVVALFVMSSVWGLVRFIGDEFSITNNDTMQIPKIQE